MMAECKSVNHESVNERKTDQEGVEHLLDVDSLRVDFKTDYGLVRANRSVSLCLDAGHTHGLVGESGCGKSVFCRAILRLLPSPPAIIQGNAVRYAGEDLLTASEKRIREIRGTELGMIFQNPMTSLNPVWPIGDQVTESLRVHKKIKAREARQRGVDLLTKVGIPSPRRRYDEYPHQWSGGMLQRAVIAMAMAGSPRLLLADEPTTALDVTIQDQILALLLELQRKENMSLLLVSHDMAVIAETCDRVAVMYAGILVETGTTEAIFANPKHPYTLGLMRSIPRISEEVDRLASIPGQPPELLLVGAECPFEPRCEYASRECRHERIELKEIEPGHSSACLFPERVA